MRYFFCIDEAYEKVYKLSIKHQLVRPKNVDYAVWICSKTAANAIMVFVQTRYGSKSRRNNHYALYDHDIRKILTIADKRKMTFRRVAILFILRNLGFKPHTCKKLKLKR